MHTRLLKSRVLSEEEHQRIVEDTADFVQRLIDGSNNVILMGDFNCMGGTLTGLECRKRRGDVGKQTNCWVLQWLTE